ANIPTLDGLQGAKRDRSALPGPELDGGTRALPPGVVALRDLSDAEAPAAAIARVRAELGPIRALVMSHAHSVDSGILD
ncbi:hypothetical protein SB717_39420, partial [Priestia sp. SIMBA_032]|uniref:hypothetical protein n=1 Tax=Priestia sp. SIMBA_032 TaxID=3085775 RepID=UPI00397C9549